MVEMVGILAITIMVIALIWTQFPIGGRNPCVHQDIIDNHNRYARESCAEISILERSLMDCIENSNDPEKVTKIALKGLSRSLKQD